MAHQFDRPDADWGELEPPAEWDSWEEDEDPVLVDEPSDATVSPSVPIVLFSAACGIAGGVLALYASFRWFDLPVELSAGVATLGLLFSLGISGAALSAATGSRAAPVNILFSCGVILLGILFLALCLLVGALLAALVI